MTALNTIDTMISNFEVNAGAKKSKKNVGMPPAELFMQLLETPNFETQDISEKKVLQRQELQLSPLEKTSSQNNLPGLQGSQPFLEKENILRKDPCFFQELKNEPINKNIKKEDSSKNSHLMTSQDIKIMPSKETMIVTARENEFKKDHKFIERTVETQSFHKTQSIIEHALRHLSETPAIPLLRQNNEEKEKPLAETFLKSTENFQELEKDVTTLNISLKSSQKNEIHQMDDVQQDQIQQEDQVQDLAQEMQLKQPLPFINSHKDKGIQALLETVKNIPAVHQVKENLINSQEIPKPEQVAVFQEAIPARHIISQPVFLNEIKQQAKIILPSMMNNPKEEKLALNLQIPIPQQEADNILRPTVNTVILTQDQTNSVETKVVKEIQENLPFDKEIIPSQTHIVREEIMIESKKFSSISTPLSPLPIEPVKMGIPIELKETTSITHIPQPKFESVESIKGYHPVEIVLPTPQKPGLLKIELTPAHLGKVNVELNIAHDGRIDAVVEVEKSETLNLLTQNTKELYQVIAQSFEKEGGELQLSLNMNHSEKRGFEENQGHSSGHKRTFTELNEQDILEETPQSISNPTNAQRHLDTMA